MLSEFRNSTGVLSAFEVGLECTTFGALCCALPRLPGVRFASSRRSLWSSEPARFTFKDREYEVNMPFAGYRVGPVDRRAAYPETEELLTCVKRDILARRLDRLRSRLPTSEPDGRPPAAGASERDSTD